MIWFWFPLAPGFWLGSAMSSVCWSLTWYPASQAMCTLPTCHAGLSHLFCSQIPYSEDEPSTALCLDIAWPAVLRLFSISCFSFCWLDCFRSVFPCTLNSGSSSLSYPYSPASPSPWTVSFPLLCPWLGVGPILMARVHCWLCPAPEGAQSS